MSKRVEPISPGDARGENEVVEGNRDLATEAINKRLRLGERSIPVSQPLSRQDASYVAMGYRQRGWKVMIKEILKDGPAFWNFHFDDNPPSWRKG